MKLKAFFSKPLGIFAAISVVAVAGVIAGVATHHSQSKGTSVTQSSDNQASTSEELPQVSANAGAAPTISKPEGTPPSALVTKDIIEGTGTAATSASTVTAQYVLMSWKTGTIIQSSWSQGPATFPLSAVIPGWQQGIPGMKVGGRRLLVVPPALGYGAAGSGPVGANETLVFVVDLVAVR